MQTLSAAFATMVTGNDLLVHNTVQITVADAPQYSDATLACESVNIERNMTTDAPAQTRMVSGYPAAGATVVLSGLLDPLDGSSEAAALYDPYNAASPIYRELLLDAPVVLRAGLWVGDAVPELATMFTGFVDSYDVDPITGVVTVQCIDGRNRLRSIPELLTTVCNPMPACEASSSDVVSTPHTPGLTNLYVLDSILRANGVYASPPLLDGAVYGASMAGGGHPQRYNPAGLPTYCDKHQDDPGSLTRNGSVSLATGEDIPLMVQVPGYWAQQVPRSHLSYAACPPLSAVDTDGIQLLAGSGYTYQAMVNFQTTIAWPGQASTPTPEIDFNLYVNTGTLDAFSYYLSWTLRPSGTPDGWVFDGGGAAQAAHPLTITAGWHELQVRVTLPTSTTQRTKVYIDNVVVLDTTEALDSTTGSYGKVFTSVVERCSLTMEAIQLMPASVAPTSYTTFTPGAYLDASLNSLTATIDVSASDAWTVVQDLAVSEYALAGFDELGIFRYLNRNTLRGGATTRQVSSASSLKGLAFSAQAASSINRVRVPVNAVLIGQFQAVWTGFYDDNTQTTGYVPAKGAGYGGSYPLATPFTGLSTYVYGGLFPPAVDVNGSGNYQLVGPGTFHDGSGYRACRTLDGSGAAVTSGITFTIYQYGSQTLNVQLSNANNFPVYFDTPTGHGYAAGDVGKPLMIVGANPVYFGSTAGGEGAAPGQAAATEGEVLGLNPPAVPTISSPDANAQWVVDGATERALQLTASPWVQVYDDAQQLAEDLLADLVYARPVLTNTVIVADPRTQLADRLHLYDPEASGMDDDTIVFGVSTSISATAWDQALDLRATSQPGFWVLGELAHSEINLTTWL